MMADQLGLLGLDITQAHKHMDLCSNKQVNSRSNTGHSKVNGPKRNDDSRNKDTRVVESLVARLKIKSLSGRDSRTTHRNGDQHRNSLDQHETKNTERSIFSSSEDEHNDSSSSEYSSSSSDSSTKSPSPIKKMSAKSSSLLKRSDKEKLDETLKRIKYLEEKQLLQDHQLKMMAELSSDVTEFIDVTQDVAADVSKITERLDKVPMASESRVAEMTGVSFWEGQCIKKTLEDVNTFEQLAKSGPLATDVAEVTGVSLVDQCMTKTLDDVYIVEQQQAIPQPLPSMPRGRVSCNEQYCSCAHQPYWNNNICRTSLPIECCRGSFVQGENVPMQCCQDTHVSNDNLLRLQNTQGIIIPSLPTPSQEGTAHIVKGYLTLEQQQQLEHQITQWEQIQQQQHEHRQQLNEEIQELQQQGEQEEQHVQHLQHLQQIQQLHQLSIHLKQQQGKQHLQQEQQPELCHEILQQQNHQQQQEQELQQYQMQQQRQPLHVYQNQQDQQPHESQLQQVQHNQQLQHQQQAPQQLQIFHPELQAQQQELEIQQQQVQQNLQQQQTQQLQILHPELQVSRPEQGQTQELQQQQHYVQQQQELQQQQHNLQMNQPSYLNQPSYVNLIQTFSSTGKRVIIPTPCYPAQHNQSQLPHIPTDQLAIPTQITSSQLVPSFPPASTAISSYQTQYPELDQSLIVRHGIDTLGCGSQNTLQPCCCQQTLLQDCVESQQQHCLQQEGLQTLGSSSVTHPLSQPSQLSVTTSMSQLIPQSSPSPLPTLSSTIRSQPTLQTLLTSHQPKPPSSQGTSGDNKEIQENDPEENNPEKDTEITVPDHILKGIVEHSPLEGILEDSQLKGILKSLLVKTLKLEEIPVESENISAESIPDLPRQLKVIVENKPTDPEEAQTEDMRVPDHPRQLKVIVENKAADQTEAQTKDIRVPDHTSRLRGILQNPLSEPLKNDPPASCVAVPAHTARLKGILENPFNPTNIKVTEEPSGSSSDSSKSLQLTETFTDQPALLQAKKEVMEQDAPSNTTSQRISESVTTPRQIEKARKAKCDVMMTTLVRVHDKNAKEQAASSGFPIQNKNSLYLPVITISNYEPLVKAVELNHVMNTAQESSNVSFQPTDTETMNTKPLVHERKDTSLASSSTDLSKPSSVLYVAQHLPFKGSRWDTPPGMIKSTELKGILTHAKPCSTKSNTSTSVSNETSNNHEFSKVSSETNDRPTVIKENVDTNHNFVSTLVSLKTNYTSASIKVAAETSTEPNLGKLTTETNSGPALFTESNPKSKLGKLTVETNSKPTSIKVIAERSAKKVSGKLTAETNSKPKSGKISAETNSKPKSGKISAETNQKSKSGKLSAESKSKPTSAKVTGEKEYLPVSTKNTAKTHIKPASSTGTKEDKSKPRSIKEGIKSKSGIVLTSKSMSSKTTTEIKFTPISCKVTPETNSKPMLAKVTAENNSEPTSTKVTVTKSKSKTHSRPVSATLTTDNRSKATSGLQSGKMTADINSKPMMGNKCTPTSAKMTTGTCSNSKLPKSSKITVHTKLGTTLEINSKPISTRVTGITGELNSKPIFMLPKVTEKINFKPLSTEVTAETSAKSMSAEVINSEPTFNKVIVEFSSKPISDKVTKKANSTPIPTEVRAKTHCKPVSAKVINSNPTSNNVTVESCSKPVLNKVTEKTNSKPTSTLMMIKANSKPMSDKVTVKTKSKPTSDKVTVDNSSKPMSDKVMSETNFKLKSTEVTATTDLKPVSAKVIKSKPTSNKVTEESSSKPMSDKVTGKTNSKPTSTKVMVETNSKPMKDKVTAEIKSKPMSDKITAETNSDVLWVVGDDILVGAKEQNSLITGIKKVIWLETKRLTLTNLASHFDQWSVLHPKPTHLILHIGINDMARCSYTLHCRKIDVAVYFLRELLPECIIFWSEIISKPGTVMVDRKQAQINKYTMETIKTQSNMYIIEHDNVDYNGLFDRSDLMRLTDMGLKKLLKTLQFTLQLVCDSNEAKSVKQEPSSEATEILYIDNIPTSIGVVIKTKSNDTTCQAESSERSLQHIGPKHEETRCVNTLIESSGENNPSTKTNTKPVSATESAKTSPKLKSVKLSAGSKHQAESAPLSETNDKSLATPSTETYSKQAFHKLHADPKLMAPLINFSEKTKPMPTLAKVSAGPKPMSPSAKLCEKTISMPKLAKLSEEPKFMSPSAKLCENTKIVPTLAKLLADTKSMSPLGECCEKTHLMPTLAKLSIETKTMSPLDKLCEKTNPMPTLVKLPEDPKSMSPLVKLSEKTKPVPTLAKLSEEPKPMSPFAAIKPMPVLTKLSPKTKNKPASAKSLAKSKPNPSLAKSSTDTKIVSTETSADLSAEIKHVSTETSADLSAEIKHKPSSANPSVETKPKASTKISAGTNLKPSSAGRSVETKHISVSDESLASRKSTSKAFSDSKFNRLWIIGDDILDGAETRAALTEKENFGLPKATTAVSWCWSKGATLSGFVGYFQLWLLYFPPPTYLIIHLGINDLLLFDEEANLGNINIVLQYMRAVVPDCITLWSEIPKLSYPMISRGIMDCNRVRLNQYVIMTVHDLPNFHFIRHEYDYYRNPSRYLTILALDKLLRTYREALQMVLKPGNNKCFPTCEDHADLDKKDDSLSAKSCSPTSHSVKSMATNVELQSASTKVAKPKTTSATSEKTKGKPTSASSAVPKPSPTSEPFEVPKPTPTTASSPVTKSTPTRDSSVVTKPTPTAAASVVAKPKPTMSSSVVLKSMPSPASSVVPKPKPSSAVPKPMSTPETSVVAKPMPTSASSVVAKPASTSESSVVDKPMPTSAPCVVAKSQTSTCSSVVGKPKHAPSVSSAKPMSASSAEVKKLNPISCASVVINTKPTSPPSKVTSAKPKSALSVEVKKLNPISCASVAINAKPILAPSKVTNTKPMSATSADVKKLNPISCASVVINTKPTSAASKVTSDKPAATSEKVKKVNQISCASMAIHAKRTPVSTVVLKSKPSSGPPVVAKHKPTAFVSVSTRAKPTVVKMNSTTVSSVEAKPKPSSSVSLVTNAKPPASMKVCANDECTIDQQNRPVDITISKPSAEINETLSRHTPVYLVLERKKREAKVAEGQSVDPPNKEQTHHANVNASPAINMNGEKEITKCKQAPDSCAVQAVEICTGKKLTNCKNSSVSKDDDAPKEETKLGKNQKDESIYVNTSKSNVGSLHMPGVVMLENFFEVRNFTKVRTRETKIVSLDNKTDDQYCADGSSTSVSNHLTEQLEHQINDFIKQMRNASSTSDEKEGDNVKMQRKYDVKCTSKDEQSTNESDDWKHVTDFIKQIRAATCKQQSPQLNKKYTENTRQRHLDVIYTTKEGQTADESKDSLEQHTEGSVKEKGTSNLKCEVRQKLELPLTSLKHKSSLGSVCTLKRKYKEVELLADYESMCGDDEEMSKYCSRKVMPNVVAVKQESDYDVQGSSDRHTKADNEICVQKRKHEVLEDHEAMCADDKKAKMSKDCGRNMTEVEVEIKLEPDSDIVSSDQQKETECKGVKCKVVKPGVKQEQDGDSCIACKYDRTKCATCVASKPDGVKSTKSTHTNLDGIINSRGTSKSKCVANETDIGVNEVCNRSMKTLQIDVNSNIVNKWIKPVVKTEHDTECHDQTCAACKEEITCKSKWEKISKPKCVASETDIDVDQNCDRCKTAVQIDANRNIVHRRIKTEGEVACISKSCAKCEDERLRPYVASETDIGVDKNRDRTAQISQIDVNKRKENNEYSGVRSVLKRKQSTEWLSNSPCHESKCENSANADNKMVSEELRDFHREDGHKGHRSSHRGIPTKKKHCLEETLMKEKALTTKDEHIWIIGDFIMEKAYLRAKQQGNGHLGFTSIEWHTSTNAGLDQKYLKRRLKHITDPYPTFILIHLGANDLKDLNIKEFGEKVGRVICDVKKYLPCCHIVWSSMLLHCLCNLSVSIKQIDATRLNANKEAKEQLESYKMVHFISYDQVFKRNARSLYEIDGLKLSQKGVDTFLVILATALGEFLKNPDQRYFPAV